MMFRSVCPYAFALSCLALVHCSSTPSDDGSQIGIQQAALAAGDARVAMVQSAKANTADITLDDVRAQVRQAVDLAGGFDTLIHDGDTVVLKPNLVGINDFSLPNWAGVPIPPGPNGVTTDWRVTEAVVELVREKDPNGKVYVMEGSAASTAEAFAHYLYTPANMPGVTAFIALESESGGWLEYTSPNLVQVSPTGAILQPSYYLNRIYQEANVLISIPTLKNHFNAVVSGSIKNVGIGATPANIYGISPTNNNRQGGIDHGSIALHQHVHDWFLARPIDFVVMDGLQGIQNGPTPCYDYTGHTSLSQDQMNMRLILAGRDAVAVDTIESLTIGWDPASVEHLRLLSVDGAGQGDSAKILVVGKKVDEVRKSFAGTNHFVFHGAKITDSTPPAMTVASTSQPSPQQFRFSLAADPADLKRVEVFVGTTMLATVTGSYTDVTVDLSTLAVGTYDVTLDGYDVFRNRTTIVLPQAINGDHPCALGKLKATAAVASSVENAGTPASAAIDGSLTTRWSSAFADPQWIYADLGAKMHVGRVILRWETAAAKDYDVQVSDDASAWTTIATDPAGAGGVKQFEVSAAGRYVRMFARTRKTVWGDSLWELEVYGDTNGACGGGTGDGGIGDGGTGDGGTGDGGTGDGGSVDSCTPQCSGKVCGDDGCGGSCGTCAAGQTCNAGVCQAACKDVALPRTSASASSLERSTLPASAAIDGNVKTRWSSAFSDPQWIVVDLGTSRYIKRVILRWQNASSADYDVQVSPDGKTWTTKFTGKAKGASVDTITSGLGVAARYVRMYSRKRNTQYGDSLWEFEIYGDTNPACTP